MRRKSELMKKYKFVYPLLTGLILYLVMFGILLAIITPDRYDIKVGYPAPVTIFATKDVEDAVTTQELREQAANAVEYSYKSVDTSITNQVSQAFNDVYLLILSLSDEYSLTSVDEITETQLTDIIELTGVNLSKNDIITSLTSTREEMDEVFTATRALIRESLDSTLPEGQEVSAISRISRELVSDGYSASIVSVAIAAARATIKPNMLIDAETTEINREKARETVEAQMCVKGEAVVREGDIVTLAQFQILSSLGIIKDSSVDFLLVLGLAVLIALLLTSLALYMYLFEPDMYLQPKKLMLLAIIITLNMIISVATKMLNAYLMPVSLGLMLTATLLTPKLALYVNVMLGLITSLFATATSGFFTMAMFSIVIMAIASGPIVVLIVTHKLQRTSMLLAGVTVALANFITTFSVGLINSTSISTIVTNAAWAAAGGILSAVICIGVQPLLEWMFNLVTSAKLLELSNPNQPLLHRLLLEAPGTYHHSIIVANLADAAASAIGANALLARVGAYYHDIGKLKRPMYFMENQIGDNPHDRTDPRVSAAILTAHTRDGAQYAQKEHLPEEIVEIITQHHGDSPVLYFYDKAKKLYGEDIDISQFRYEGPRPEHREAAVVMLADIIEAATRSMPSHTPQKIEQFVRKLIRDKLTDGQLDKSNLTFTDLDAICNAFITVLTGVFHERIEYPNVQLPPRDNSKEEEKNADRAAD